jgi:hypothetical protein
MKNENIYNSISKYSVATILNKFMFDSEPTMVFLGTKAY